MDLSYVRGVERLLHVVQDLSTARDLPSVQEIVRHAARELTGADGATFVLREGEHCFYADEDAIAPLWKGRRFPIEQCVSGWVMRNHAPVAIEDIYADERVPIEAYRPTFVKSMAMVPIRTSAPVGAIGNYWASQRTPTETELRLLQALADSVSIAIENVRLYHELETRVQERTAALDALRATEQQLRHSQKMEAVGQIAGAIAHDFNNLISVILMNCAAVAGELSPENPLRQDLDEIRMACERAAKLTRQVLAFSRQQVFEPAELQVNDVIAGIEKMIRRLLGRGILLEMWLGEGLPLVLADTGQLEQVLLNLAVNARDAMPNGGKLVIETGVTHLAGKAAARHIGWGEGEFVRINVSDSGLGMEPEILNRLFEPFFTTKELGKGTGLGLSTAYGIIKQSGGSIAADSEPGRGSTFQVFLPPSRGAANQAHVLPAVKPFSGKETVLVVDDDAQVRAAVNVILGRHGYRVVEARSAEDALDWLALNGDRIDLLLTDVMLPGKSGVALAAQVLALPAAPRVVCMSGASHEQHVRAELGEKSAFVSKPLVPEGLLVKVRQVLDTPSEA